MRRLPWRSIVKVERKSLLTAVAISFVTAFALAGFSLAALLSGETVSDDGPYGRPEMLHATASGADATVVRVGTVTLADGTLATLATFEGPRAPPVPADEAWTSGGGREALPLANGTTLRVRSIDHLPHASRYWYLVADDAVLEGSDDRYEYALGPGDAPLALAPGVQPFMSASGREVGRDLLLVVVFAAALVTVFTYEFIRSDVRERRGEIAIWRSLGMRRREVFALVLGRAALICGAAALLGVVASYAALRAAKQATGIAVITVPEGEIALGVLVALTFAGVSGAALPARDAARIEIREALEANL